MAGKRRDIVTNLDGRSCKFIKCPSDPRAIDAQWDGKHVIVGRRGEIVVAHLDQDGEAVFSVRLYGSINRDDYIIGDDGISGVGYKCDLDEGLVITGVYARHIKVENS